MARGMWECLYGLMFYVLYPMFYVCTYMRHLTQGPIAKERPAAQVARDRRPCATARSQHATNHGVAMIGACTAQYAGSNLFNTRPAI